MSEFYEVQLRHVWDDEEGWCEVGVYDTLAEALFSYSDCITHDVGQDIDNQSGVIGYQIRNGKFARKPTTKPSLIRGCGYDEVRIVYYNYAVPNDHVIVVAYKRSE